MPTAPPTTPRHARLPSLSAADWRVLPWPTSDGTNPPQWAVNGAVHQKLIFDVSVVTAVHMYVVPVQVPGPQT